MKKYLYISALSVSLVAISSCDLDAPTQSSMDGASVFSIYELAESSVMGINQSFGETNSYRGRFLPYYGLNTDIEWINSNDGTKMPDEGKYDLCTYAATPSNGQMNTDNNAYAKFYEGVERANNAIKGIREFGNLDDPNMKQLLGELLTMRAVLYLDLIKGWGDVPYRFEPINTETIYLPRTDRDVIYKQLLADLEEAELYCAWPNGSSITSTAERVNRAFVRGLRARIALYAGGYSQRADGVRLSNDPELSQSAMYAIALKECKAVLDSVKFDYGKYGDGTNTFLQNFYNLSTDVVAAGKESLWEIPFSETRGRVMYTYGIKHQAADQFTRQNQGGVNGPLPTLFYDYDIDDIRRDITCAPYRWSSTGVADVDSENKSFVHACQELWGLKTWCFGKLRYEWTIDKRRVTNTNDDGINWQYMRMADISLMAAEAANEIDGQSSAWNYMKPVLDRALPADKVSALETKYTASKEAFFQGVVEQRAFEFAGEMLRKADLIRWNLLDKKLAEAKEKMIRLRNREGEYADLPANLYWTLVDKDGNVATGEGAEKKNIYLKVYGLNHGETDEEGKLLENDGYQKLSWINESKLPDGYIKGLVENVSSANQNQYWPIWKSFIDKSNGTLDNNWLNK